jgi:hypothetical protein
MTAELDLALRKLMKALIATLAVTVALVLPEAASAQGFPGGGGIGVGVPSTGLGASPCGTGIAGGQGSPAAPAVCTSGLSFVAPTIGQIASTIGPTIITGAVVGTTIIVASGSNVTAPGSSLP